MAILNLNVPDELKARAQARAAESGFTTLEQYVEQLLRADAGESDGNEIDEQVEALLLQRLDGPAVTVDHADFQRMRAKFQAHLDAESGAQP